MLIKEISPARLTLKSIAAWADDWFLLTSGDFNSGQYNCMTVAWGSVGVMWSKPFVQVVVRPGRYTYQFMETFESFSLCAFTRKYRSVLNYLGSVSGRQVAKLAQAGLTPIAATRINAPIYREASLRIECQKIYYDDFKPGNFLTPDIASNYPKQDYHRIYFGAIVAITGTSKYCNQD